MKYAILLFVFVSCVTETFSQSNPVYVPFQGPQGGPAPSIVKGALYKPDHGPAPHVAFLVMHRSANVMGPNIHTQELAKRGYMVLGLNTHAENNEAAVMWDEFPLDVKVGVEFLRKQPGITKVILLGHSGGGAT